MNRHKYGIVTVFNFAFDLIETCPLRYRDDYTNDKIFTGGKHCLNTSCQSFVSLRPDIAILTSHDADRKVIFESRTIQDMIKLMDKLSFAHHFVRSWQVHIHLEALKLK